MTDPTDMDDLIAEASAGTRRDAMYNIEDALENLEGLMRRLGIDRRESMPDDEDSFEYRIREAYAELEELADELRRLNTTQRNIC